MIDITYLQLFTFVVFFVSVVAYAALDGFDLGVGCLHLFARNDHERRIFLNAIGPVWDGNSVWIVISMGVLFAGFPKAFVALTGGLYLPMFLLVFCFMFRSAAIEFRSKLDRWWWRNMWDIFFFLSSLLLSLDLGMIIGNVIAGLPIGPQGHIDPNNVRFLNAYSVAIGVMNLHLFMMHGAIYLILKTEGELRERLQELATVIVRAFLLFWVVGTVLTAILEPHMLQRFIDFPVLFVVAAAAVGTVFLVLRFEQQNAYFPAFVASAGSIAMLVALVGIGLYPYILPSTLDPATNSLTIFNSSSSQLTLTVIGIVVLIGVPLSVFYLSYLYKVFHGKVEITEHSY